MKPEIIRVHGSPYLYNETVLIIFIYELLNQKLSTSSTEMAAGTHLLCASQMLWFVSTLILQMETHI